MRVDAFDSNFNTAFSELAIDLVPPATPTPPVPSSPTPTETPVPPACAGDCDTSGRVTISELLTMVNIALEQAAISVCDAGDVNHDTHITVEEILKAVANSRDDCAGTVGSAAHLAPHVPM